MYTFPQFTSSENNRDLFGLMPDYLQISINFHRMSNGFIQIPFLLKIPFKHFTISYILIHFSISFLIFICVTYVVYVCIRVLYLFIFPFRLSVCFFFRIYRINTGKMFKYEQNNLFGQKSNLLKPCIIFIILSRFEWRMCHIYTFNWEI